MREQSNRRLPERGSLSWRLTHGEQGVLVSKLWAVALRVVLFTSLLEGHLGIHYCAEAVPKPGCPSTQTPMQTSDPSPPYTIVCTCSSVPLLSSVPS